MTSDVTSDFPLLCRPEGPNRVFPSRFAFGPSGYVLKVAHVTLDTNLGERTGPLANLIRPSQFRAASTRVCSNFILVSDTALDILEYS